jgi:ABC-type lipoprotein export system ATPase subunit
VNAAIPVVSAHGLVRRYQRGTETVVALDGVDIEVAAGAFVGVAGPSGSGKTTLCNMLAGLDAPDSGTVTWHGDARLPPPWRQLAVVPQRLALVQALTLADAVWLAASVTGAHAVEPSTVVADLGVDHLLERRPSEMSHGEQQRAAIVRALVGGPDLVVLDEPTSSQDEERVDRITAALVAAAARGTAVVVATHDARVLDTTTRIVRLVDGHVAGVR